MKTARRLIVVGFTTVLVFAVAFCGWVYLSQDRMIFHPQAYTAADVDGAPARTQRLEYQTASGKQVSWYVPPRAAGEPQDVPARLWILFGGNASLALYWTDHVRLAPDEEAGFLLFDYPGYGECAGNASPGAITKSADAAVAALAKYLDMEKEVLLDRPIRVLGHSLGAAVALDFAKNYKLDRLIIAAPFTTMQAMADKVAGRHLSWLLRHKFDNLQAMEKLAAKAVQPQLVVMHGGMDMVIPIEMSRELDQRWPQLVELIEIPHASHSSVLDQVRYFMAPQLPSPVRSLEQVKQSVSQKQPAPIAVAEATSGA